MAEYVIEGPFEVPTEKLPGGKTIDRRAIKDFWADTACGEKAGIYIFAMRTGRNIVPTYVGKATNTFQQEAFQYHKLADHYLPAILEYKRGTPVMLFVTPIRNRGRIPRAEIGDIEDFMIQTAVSKNPNLSNVKGVKEKQWKIRGLIRSRGRRSKTTSLFAKMMGL